MSHIGWEIQSKQCERCAKRGKLDDPESPEICSILAWAQYMGEAIEWQNGSCEQYVADGAETTVALPEPVIDACVNAIDELQHRDIWKDGFAQSVKDAITRARHPERAMEG